MMSNPHAGVLALPSDGAGPRLLAAWSPAGGPLPILFNVRPASGG